jgi:hypothetical protein
MGTIEDSLFKKPPPAAQTLPWTQVSKEISPPQLNGSLGAEAI